MLLYGARSKENWEDWLQSFDWYAEASQLETRSKKVAIFMMSIGRDAQQIFNFRFNRRTKRRFSGNQR